MKLPFILKGGGSDHLIERVYIDIHPVIEFEMRESS